MNQGIDNSFIVAIAVGLIIFLAGRELFCWYWKLNKVVSLLTEIRDQLRLEADRSRSA